MKFLVLFFCCWIYLPVGSAAEQDNKLLKVQGKIKNVNSKLSTLKKQEGNAQNKLKQLEVQYGKTSKKLRYLGAKLKEKKQRIKEIQQDIKLQKKWLAGQEKYIEGQIKAAYILGKQEPLKLLLSQEDIGKASRMLRYYHYFHKERVNQIQQINNSLQLLQGLEKEKHQELLQVADLAGEQKNKQKVLMKTKGERKRVLKSIKKDFKKHKKKLSKLKKNAQELKGLVSSLRLEKPRPIGEVKAGQPFRHLKAKLAWPVKGKILKKFGSRRVDSQWNGVLIRAKEGTQVKAIATGRVIFSDWLKGYGLLLIVQHDKNYMSLYAYNQSLYKSKGDWVSAGDVLATVGKSGGRSKSALYFEIRKKNKPVNPAKWCR